MTDTMKEVAESRDPLVSHVRETFQDFENERRVLEERWSMNYDAFRGEYSSGNLAKWKALEGSEWRSKVFVRITKMKVVAAVAQILDVLLQGGGTLPFGLKLPTGVQQPFPKEEAEARLDAMNARLTGILTDCQYDRRLMTSVLEAALYGMCVQRAPVVHERRRIGYKFEIPTPAGFPNLQVNNKVMQRFGRHTPHIENVLMPKVNSPSLWNIFWDREAENIQEGRAVIERIRVTPQQLRRMASKKKGWDMEAVEKVIQLQGEKDATGSFDSEGPAKQMLQKRKQTIEILDFWGLCPNRYLKGKELNYNHDGKETEIHTIIADQYIVRKPINNPLPGEWRPFHMAFYEKIPHESEGTGIPTNMQDSQMMVNSGVRCFIDNKALSGNVLSAVNTGVLDPTTNMSIYPGKSFKFVQGVGRVADAIQFFSPPDVGRGLLEMVNLFERFADEESGIPKMMQGETQQNDPDTAYAYSRLIEAGNKQMGNVIRNLDEGIIEPVVGGLYHYLMAFDPDEGIKANLQVQAMGFSSYTDRITRGNNITEFLMMMMGNPILARLLKPAPMVREIAKTRDLDVDMFVKTDPELEAEARMLAAQLAEQDEGGGEGGGQPGTGGPQGLPSQLNSRPDQPAEMA